MALYARITCYAPLGQVSVVSTNQEQILVTVVVEWSRSLPEFQWDVRLCSKRCGNGQQRGKWTNELPLLPSKTCPQLLSLGSESQEFRCSFTGLLRLRSADTSNGDGSCSFTVKYRIDSHSPWQWVQPQFGTQHGELVLQKPMERDSLDTYMHITPDWTFDSMDSCCEFALTFDVRSKSTIPQKNGIDAKVEATRLGWVTDQMRYHSLVRISEPWLAPRHGRQDLWLTEDAVMVTFLNTAGHHITLLPVNGIDSVLTQLTSDEDGNIIVTARNDSDVKTPFQLVVAIALGHEESIVAAVRGLRQFVDGHPLSQNGKETISHAFQKPTVDTTVSQNDSWYDGLAYCTYNSLGVNLTSEKILQGLESLEKDGIHISSLVIDDNWQTLDGHKDDGIWQLHRSWKEFEANKQGFPNGLAATVQEIRRRHPSLVDIAVWHALLGYWKGISPDGSIAQDYETVEVESQLMGHVTTKMRAVHPDDAARFYDSFYAFLSSCGITAVKTDVQFMLDNLQSTSSRASFTQAYQSAWTGAHLKHFSGHAISCMSMVPQILFHSFLQPTFPRVTLRNSDDFFPEIPSSHAIHVFINAHNALLTRQLNAILDWDMFQTSHPYAAFHAASRCLSGGPIYITDTPGEHDVGLIRQMTAPNTAGRTVVLRPSSLGRSLNAYDAFTEGHALKIGTFHAFEGDRGDGAALLGLFNVSEKQISVLVDCVADFRSCVGNEPVSPVSEDQSKDEKRILVRSHRSGKFFPAMTSSLLSPKSLVHASIPVRGWEILSMHPVHTVVAKKAASPVSIAVLGFLHKMAGPAGVKAVAIKTLAGGADDVRIRVVVQLKALGTLGIWLEGDLARYLGKCEVLLQGKKISSQRIVFKRCGAEGVGHAESDTVVEVDVEKSWDVLKTRAGEAGGFEVEMILG